MPVVGGGRCISEKNMNGTPIRATWIRTLNEYVYPVAVWE
jgi:hypothetical protein